jgi:hypothetical protein
MEDEDSHVGSPSPPFEGIIHEEAEKQLESKGGDFDMTEISGDIDEVIITNKQIEICEMKLLTKKKLKSLSRQKLFKIYSPQH